MSENNPNSETASSERHIACADYDYIEIMCLYRYRVKVTMRDLSQVQGQFFNTQLIEVDGIKRESMVGIDIHQLPLQLILSEIMTIDVLDEHAKFHRLSLA